MKILLLFLATVFRLFGQPVDAADLPISIQAINPGYTIDGKANSGEFIELKNSSDHSILLTGLSLTYTNSSGNRVVLYEFPDGSSMAGETLLLRLASSPEADQANLIYTKTLAFSAGPLELSYNDEVIDSVCWTGKDGCYDKFTSTRPTSLVRNSDNTFSHLEDYSPLFDPEHISYQPPATPIQNDEQINPQCWQLQFSEILSYYETQKSEQFIEFHNPTDHDINLTGCQIRYKSKTYALSGIVQSDQYLARYIPNLTLTKNPTSSNKIELVDVDGKTVDTLTYYNGQKKATSYAQFGYQTSGEEQWLQTYAPTPNEPNNYQQFRACEAGKVINEATGNCVKATSIAKLAPCPAGKYRSPETNRCRSVSGSSTKTLAPCAAGYERNPETNRCRKIKTNTGAAYPLAAQATNDQSSFVALGAVLIMIILALIYIIFQFRYEILSFFRRIRQKISV